MAKKNLVVIIVLFINIAIFFPCQAAEIFSISQAPAALSLGKEKEMNMALAIQEAQAKFTQREHIWKKDTEPPEKIEKKSPVQLGGYFKNLYTNSKTTDTKEGYFTDLSRLRMELKVKPSEEILANIVFDQETLAHDFGDSADFQAIKNNNQKNLAFIDADKAYCNDRNFYAKYSLYRGYIKYDNQSLQAIVGKQLVDWGRCRFWSPLDLFNPLNPLNIERDERLGTDAANLEVALGPLVNLNLVYAPQPSWAKSSFGSRLYYRAGNWDLFLLGGDFKNDAVVGFCADGYLGNGGLRLELSYTDTDNGRNFARAVVGGEYNFTNKLHVLTEYFYNGGADDSNVSEFMSSYKYSSKVLTLKKNLLGLWLGYEITPLLKWDNYTIYDFDQKGVFFNPEFKYNLWANFDVSAGAQLFWGNHKSEFGDYQNVYYAQAQYFF